MRLHTVAARDVRAHVSGDGTPEMAVGGIKSQTDSKGAVYILFLTPGGAVKRHVEISADMGMEARAVSSL